MCQSVDVAYGAPLFKSPFRFAKLTISLIHDWPKPTSARNTHSAVRRSNRWNI